jgi:replicative DNA helicase
MDQVADLVLAEDFYDRRHGLIFEAMLALYNSHQPLDEITVTSRLADEAHLETVGGAAYLAELADILLGPAHVEHYANLIAEKAWARKFIAATQEAHKAVTAATDIPSAIEEAEQLIFASAAQRQVVEAERVGDGLPRTLHALEQKKTAGLPTGFRDLDKLLVGMEPGDFVVIAGRPSMGKTALAMQIGAKAAQAGHKTLVFSLEMSREQLHLRLMASEGRVSMQAIKERNLTQDDFGRLTRAADKIAELPLYIDDTPGLSTLQLRARARRMASKVGVDLIIIDYLQLMHGRREKDGSREQEVSDISRNIKALAKELGVPVIGLSQLNRKVEDRGGDMKPRLSDLRESGSIEQDADIVAFVFREKVYRPELDDLTAEILVRKHRNGPTGDVKLTFLDKFTRFEDQEQYQQPPREHHRKGAPPARQVEDEHGYPPF